MPRRKPDASDFSAANGSTVGELRLSAPPDPTLICVADVPTTSDLDRVERRTLAVIIDDLVAYQNTLECATTEADREEIRAIIIERQRELIGKVDRYASVMRRLEFEAQYEKAEAERHTKRRKRYESALQFLNDYAVATMQAQNMRKLEGQGSTLKLHQSPGQLLVLAEADVPAEYKTVTVTLPASVWDAVAEKVRELMGDPNFAGDVAVCKDRAKRAIKAGAEIAGLDLVFPDSLRVE